MRSFRLFIFILMFLTSTTLFSDNVPDSYLWNICSRYEKSLLISGFLEGYDKAAMILLENINQDRLSNDEELFVVGLIHSKVIGTLLNSSLDNLIVYIDNYFKKEKNEDSDFTDAIMSYVDNKSQNPTPPGSFNKK